MHWINAKDVTKKQSQESRSKRSAKLDLKAYILHQDNFSNLKITKMLFKALKAKPQNANHAIFPMIHSCILRLCKKKDRAIPAQRNTCLHAHCTAYVRPPWRQSSKWWSVVTTHVQEVPSTWCDALSRALRHSSKYACTVMRSSPVQGVATVVLNVLSQPFEGQQTLEVQDFLMS